MNKKLMTSLACCWWAFGAFAQNTKVTVVTGPLKPDTVFLLSRTMLEPLTATRKDGRYVFRLNLKSTKGFTIYTDKVSEKIVLEPGNDLHINFGTANMKDRFTGTGASNAHVSMLLDKEVKAGAGSFNLEKISPNDLFTWMDNLHRRLLNILDINRSKMSPEMYRYQQNALFYQDLDNKISIPFNIQIIQAKKFEQSMPDSYWDLGKWVKKDDQLLDVQEYADFMFNSYIGFLRDQELFAKGQIDQELSGEQKCIMGYHIVEKNYTGTLRTAALPGYLDALMSYVKNVETIKPLLDDYVLKYGQEDKSKTRFITDKYQSYLRTTVGAIPPLFILKDLYGNEVDLTDYAGKVVYMDFWASWCGPCRYEMQHGSPKLYEKFKNNSGVVFLYISMDASEAAWKKAVAEEKVVGTHLLAPGGFNSDVKRSFNIQGIPRYIIIGKDGRIFDNNASRPSEDQTEGRINVALNAK